MGPLQHGAGERLCLQHPVAPLGQHTILTAEGGERVVGREFVAESPVVLRFRNHPIGLEPVEAGYFALGNCHLPAR